MNQGGVAAVGVGRASVGELRKQFELQRENVAALEVLAKELKKRSSDEAFDLLAEVARALVAARKLQPADTQHPAQAILSTRKLSRPDERPLFRYRLSLTEWERLREHLKQLTRTRAIERADDRDAGAFAIYAAEWFRREFEGGSYRWDELLSSVGGVAPEVTATLARRGLRWWGRTAHRTDHGEQRLMSLALEGGFPTRLLNSRERGWLAGTLRRLIARASVLGEHSLEAVLELVVADSAIPPTFRRPEFFTLLAELTIAIVDLRAETAAEAVAAGVPTSAWLDARREGWRDELPIALEGEGAGKLIDELVSQSLDRLGGAAARCWRMLVRRDGAWAPALKLAVDGEIRVPSSVRSMQSRLRVHAVGDLGDRLAGELALLDPPGEDGAWVSRPRPAAPRRALRNYAFTSAATVELRCDGQPIATFPWSAAGEPLHGDALAFVDDRDADGDSVNELTLLGGGSQRTRQKSIYVWAPADHVAKTVGGEPITCVWEGPAHRLFRLGEPSFVGAPEEEFAFYYEPNSSAGKTESLHLDGPQASDLTTLAGYQVFSGAPAVVLQSGVAKKPLSFGRVYWRHEGDPSWHDLKRQRIGVGAIELVLRSDETRAALDRVRFVVLPPDLNLRSRALVNGAADFWLEGEDGWRLEADSSERYRVEKTARGLRAAWSTDRRTLINLRLVSQEGRAAIITTRFPLGDGALVGADGAVLADKAVVTLKQMRGARAFAHGRAKLAVETAMRRDRTVYHHAFDNECSLWSLRDQIAVLMEASDDLDTEVRVAFEPNGPSVRIKRYEHEIVVSKSFVRLAQPKEGQGGRLSFEWRSLVDMTHQGRRTIAVLSTADAMSMRAFSLPDDLAGPGIVYLCEGEAVVSRSCFVPGLARDDSQFNSIQKAVSLTGPSFDAALKVAFESIEAVGARAVADLDWLHQLVALCTRLPATTFNVLKPMARRSQMLAHLIASSVDDEALERVWSLEPQLPFLWVLIPVEDWRHAFNCQYQRTVEGLCAIGWEASKAHVTATAQVNATIDKLLLLDDDLSAPISAAGLRPPPPAPTRSPRDIGQDRIRRLVGSGRESKRGSCFLSDPCLRVELEKLPEWFQGFHEDHWEGVLAPVAAALRAAGRVKLLPSQRLRIREGMLEDPEHFSEAYAACLLHLSNLSPVESSR